MVEDLTKECAYYFIALMRETKADSFKLKLDKVTLHGENIGDYELVIKKLRTPHE